MPTFAFYLLKVVLCSAILFGYYYFFLRNKVYHAYNRFYLLVTVVIAMLAPVINFNYLFMAGATTAKPIQLLQVVNSSDEYLQEVILYSHRNFISISQLLMLLYAIVSFVLLFALVKVIVQIVHLLKTNSSKYINDVVFVESNAKGTPFSFFKFIFWNNAIDLHSETGQQIFAHELAHVREKHSADKLFLNIVLILCWINPIFWLIKKELNLIHEFIADKKAVANNDASALAAMIVTSAYPKHAYLLTNHFFYSPIKRRLQMLSKYNITKAGYFYRILALPVVLFLVAAFTIKTKAGIEKIMNPANKITVVIDAGHGGSDAGQIGLDGSHEKDINLAFVKRIKELNQSASIELVFTRETDIYQSPQEKVAFAKKTGADLFISIHAASEPFATATKTGMEIWVSKDEYSNSKASKLFASSVIANFKANYGINVATSPRQRKLGIYVLQANEFPTILIETGYVSNKKDLNYLQTPKAKDDFAKNLLNAIAQYADNFRNQVYVAPILPSKKDTVPSAKNKLGLYRGEEIRNIEISKDCEVVTLKTASGKTITMSMFEAKKLQIPLPAMHPMAPASSSKPSELEGFKKTDASERVVIVDGQKIDNNIVSSTPSFTEPVHPLYFVDGKEITYQQMKWLDPNCIESVSVLKGASAEALYGKSKSINGIIEIKTKAGAIYKRDSDNGIFTEKSKKEAPSFNIEIKKAPAEDMTFTQVEEEASFPGGATEWTKYLRQNLNANTPVDEGWSAGIFKVIVKFIVNKDGTLSDVVTENYAGTKSAQQCIDLIKNGPKWIPAKQNGTTVKSIKKQPITYVIEE